MRAFYQSSGGQQLSILAQRGTQPGRDASRHARRRAAGDMPAHAFDKTLRARAGLHRRRGRGRREAGALGGIPRHKDREEEGRARGFLRDRQAVNPPQKINHEETKSTKKDRKISSRSSLLRG